MKTNEQITIEEITSEKKRQIENMAALMPDWTELSSEIKTKMGASYLRVAYDIQQAHKKASNSSSKNYQINDVKDGYLQERKNLNNSLNKVQKNTLNATACTLILSVLYPPFQITVQGMTVSQGFHWIWQKGDYQYSGVVDVALLLCEILVICLVGAISYKMASAKTTNE